MGTTAGLLASPIGEFAEKKHRAGKTGPWEVNCRVFGEMRNGGVEGNSAKGLMNFRLRKNGLLLDLAKDVQSLLTSIEFSLAELIEKHCVFVCEN